MNKLRIGFGATVLALLTLGYVASQRAAFDGSATQYAATVDQPPIKLLSLLLFIGAIVLGLIPAKEDSKS